MTSYYRYADGALSAISPEAFRGPQPEIVVRFRYALPDSEALVVASVRTPFSDIYKAVAAEAGVAPLDVERL